ncbi:MAG: hypothetical protein V1891_02970 [bacterium]
MIQNNDFDKKLLDAIKDKKIFPKPKWKFLFKKFIIWIAGILSLLLGAIAVSLIIYISKFDDRGVFRRIGKGIPEVILLSVPFFWILCLALFIFLVYLNFKKTKTGYRYSILAIIASAIFLSVLLGAVFYRAGLSMKIDDILGRKAPFYDRIINPHIQFWSKPEEGRLSGLILSKGDNFLTVVDKLKQEWNVSFKNFQNFDNIKAGVPARFIGKKLSVNEFEAFEILPMRSGRGFYDRFRPKFLSPDRHDKFRPYKFIGK